MSKPSFKEALDIFKTGTISFTRDIETNTLKMVTYQNDNNNLDIIINKSGLPYYAVLNDEVHYPPTEIMVNEVCKIIGRK